MCFVGDTHGGFKLLMSMLGKLSEKPFYKMVLGPGLLLLVIPPVILPILAHIYKAIINHYFDI